MYSKNKKCGEKALKMQSLQTEKTKEGKSKRERDSQSSNKANYTNPQSIASRPHRCCIRYTKNIAINC